MKTNQDASPGFVGSRRIGKDAQDYILGYSQPSLAGLFLALIVYPGLRPGLLSATLSRPWRDCSWLSLSTQDCVLGYSQPSLRDSIPNRGFHVGVFRVCGPTKEMKNGSHAVTALYGRASLPFVIPSEAEGPAVQRTFRGNIFRPSEA